MPSRFWFLTISPLDLSRWIVTKVMTAGTRLDFSPAATAAAVVIALLLGILVATDDCRRARAAARRGSQDDAAPSFPTTSSPENGIEKADHVLVPYDRYVELWNRANPDKKLPKPTAAPLPYAAFRSHV